ncbi:hypothetical protein [Quadrisphaera sp. INWT6]|uniref:hypothetical protein n=1 Tax=Quadrisphaera sp. INWT6 TaxID=2596917 RepID=UPI00189256DE|nr:hypothetical protein [Quadrisphaera sp. INWT6]MBF5080585.1 hypothetical protein [Quadrisphaera sp. INWT6]
MRSTTAAQRAAALAAAGLLIAVAGCSTGSEAAGPAASGPVPAVAAAQVSRVLTAVDQVDPEALDGRLGGAELDVRRAAQTVRAQVATAPEPAALAGRPLMVAVPPAGEWPRWFVTALEPGSGAVPQVVVLEQAGPRDPYRAVASAAVLPGVSLPALAQDGATVEPLPADATGLLATPADALSGYADVLTQGGASSAAATFADDALRDQVLSEQQAERDGVSEFVEYTAAHAPREGALWSLRTADGGALVLGVLSGTRSFTPRGVGVSQTLPADLAALAGRADAPDGLEVRTAEVVVLHVPAVGAAERVSLVAGARGTTGVEVR